MYRLRWIGFIGLLWTLANLDDFIASDSGQRICIETYERPHWFLFNGDYRRCILDEDHQRELVDQVLKTVEMERQEALTGLRVIQDEAMKKVHFIGVDKFVLLDKQLPPLFLSPGTPDPFYSGEYPSRLLKISFNHCDYFKMRPSDDDPDPTEFLCIGYVGTDRWQPLQGNNWHPNTPAKYVQKEAGTINMYVEVISQPWLSTVDLRYEVHGFEISDAMVNLYYDSAIDRQRAKYIELLN
jgi:hypothetical protein